MVYHTSGVDTWIGSTLHLLFLKSVKQEMSVLFISEQWNTVHFLLISLSHKYVYVNFLF